MRTASGPIAAVIPAAVVVGFMPLAVRLFTSARNKFDILTAAMAGPAIYLFVAKLVRAVTLLVQSHFVDVPSVPRSFAPADPSSGVRGNVGARR